MPPIPAADAEHTERTERTERTEHAAHAAHAATGAVDKSVSAIESDLISLRRALHRDPYVSWEEAPTMEKVADVLEAAGLTVRPWRQAGASSKSGRRAPALACARTWMRCR